MHRVTLDTSEVPAHRRLDLWRDVVCDTFVDLDCSTDAIDDFRGSIETREAGGLVMTTVDSCRQRVTRTRSRIASSREDVFLFAFGLGGVGGLVQDGREALVREGDLVVYDTARPFELVFEGDIRQGVLQVPKAHLRGRIAGLHDLTALTLTPERPLQRLTYDFLNGVARSIGEIEHDLAAILLEQAVDLLALAFANLQGPRTSKAMSAHRAATTGRLKRFVRANLRDPHLTLSETARAMKMSARHVNALLSAEDTSFGRFLLAERLDKCRRDLLRGSPTKPAIGEIAYGWGFNDPAYFSRAFRKRFGVSPTELRTGATG